MSSIVLIFQHVLGVELTSYLISKKEPYNTVPFTGAYFTILLLLFDCYALFLLNDIVGAAFHNAGG